MRVLIPGEPCAQGRPRFARVGKFVRTYDPAKSRSWKAEARHAMRAALEDPTTIAFPAGPLVVEILAVFSCPRSDWRKRETTPRRPHAKRPDAENVGKAVLDAGTGILWTDDAQVARLGVEKVIGAQGEAPYVEVRVLEFVATTPENRAAVDHGLPA